MKNNVIKLTFLVSAFMVVLQACTSDDEYIEGKIPETPVNIEKANSTFDDYNTSIPYYLYNDFALLFSTNRNSSGQNFDFVNFYTEYYYCESNKFTLNVDTTRQYTFYNLAQEKINTEFNELGPMIIASSDNSHTLFFYASDSSGSLDIYFVQNNMYDHYWDGPIKIKMLSTSYNEAYPSFNKYFNEIYYCSDSTGNYDIYKIPIPEDATIADWLRSDDNPEKISCTILNSNYDDKCPYILGRLMVFASDRDGGYGGFDLYYSIFYNDEWSEPVNFGPEINTEYDEYRPVTAFVYYYKNDLMIFSSNRPGGKGGFDLYYVGIPKMM